MLTPLLPMLTALSADSFTPDAILKYGELGVLLATIVLMYRLNEKSVDRLSRGLEKVVESIEKRNSAEEERHTQLLTALYIRQDPTMPLVDAVRRAEPIKPSLN